MSEGNFVMTDNIIPVDLKWNILLSWCQNRARHITWDKCYFLLHIWTWVQQWDFTAAVNMRQCLSHMNLFYMQRGNSLQSHMLKFTKRLMCFEFTSEWICARRRILPLVKFIWLYTVGMLRLTTTTCFLVYWSHIHLLLQALANIYSSIHRHIMGPVNHHHTSIIPLSTLWSKLYHIILAVQLRLRSLRRIYSHIYKAWEPYKPQQLESSVECSVLRINMDCRHPTDLWAPTFLRPIATLHTTDSYYTVNYLFNRASRWPSGPTCKSCIFNLSQVSLGCAMFVISPVRRENKMYMFFCMDWILKSL